MQTEPEKLSLFEKMRLEKAQATKPKKHSTEIEHLPLFDLK
jgi:hypothetical protein